MSACWLGRSKVMGDGFYVLLTGQGNRAWYLLNPSEVQKLVDGKLEHSFFFVADIEQVFGGF